MKIILISTNNNENNTEITTTVTNSFYRKLQNSQTLGGFLRYHLGLIKENVKGDNCNQIAYDFLKANVFYSL